MIGVGQRIGNYRVRRKLGQGGMGAVYEAVQEQIGRRAAIKVLHPEYANDQQSIQRFFNEARAVNIIHHQGLVGVFESGRLEDGGAYIVMEYLDGELLTRRLEKAGQIGQRDALSFGRQIAAALSAAHQKGIVHRDLKPDNIMVVSDPEAVDGERVKIFDFGIAKLRLNSLPPAHAPTEMRTQTGMIMGTPTHMAPEQCRGASDIDSKADVYSLGVIIYQMLVGHPPFVADSPGELLSMHLRDKPPNLCKLDPSIPEGLADLVHQMLAKEPEARPEMSVVVEQLEALGAHRTRRHSIANKSASVRAAALGAGASSNDRSKARPAVQTLSHAVGETLNSVAARRFAIAIAIAAILVMISGVVFFEVLPPIREPLPAAPLEVTWVLNSEPPGAAIIQVDNDQVLGTTPWQNRIPRREGNLRVSLRLPGFRDSTVVLKYSESSHQKVSLESLGGAEAPATSGQDKDKAGSSPLFSPPVQHSATATPAKRLRWVVATRPRGATVVLAEDGQVLGKTPYTLEKEAKPGMLKLLLHLDGYHEDTVILDMSVGNRPTITMQPLHTKGKGKDKAQDKTKDKAKDKLEVAPQDKPSDKAPDKPADKPADKPTEKPSEKPTEKPAEPESAKDKTPAVADEIPGA